MLNDKLDLHITKLQTDIVIPQTNRGIKLNHDGTLSIDCDVLTSLIIVSALSDLKIVNNTLIVDEDEMSRNLIRLNCNSPFIRRDSNFFEVRCDGVSIDSDFVTGNLKVKDGYVVSIVNKDYIKDNIENETWNI